MSAEHITEIVDGIAAIGKLAQCDAVLSGYLGSAEQGRRIVDIVKSQTSLILTHGTFCDPVMGHPEKGCIVPPDVSGVLFVKMPCPSVILLHPTY